MRKSKTDTRKVRGGLYLGKPTLKRVRKWLEVSGFEEGRLFRRVRVGDTIGESALSRQAIRAKIRARAEATGVESRVSGHSLRVGSAQLLAAAGASLAEMQQAGRWQEPTILSHYARAELASKGAVARLR